jgi:hypothetical protein
VEDIGKPLRHIAGNGPLAALKFGKAGLGDAKAFRKLLLRGKRI